MTTLDKAKYLAPLAEWVINKAKLGNNNSFNQLTRVFYDPKAIKKVTTDIAPRFRNTNGGYVKITKLGKRRLDKGYWAQIEYSNNYIEVYEKDVEAKEREASPVPHPWAWQQKILGKLYTCSLQKLLLTIPLTCGQKYAIQDNNC